jgi:hypothetical protein
MLLSASLWEGRCTKHLGPSGQQLRCRRKETRQAVRQSDPGGGRELSYLLILLGSNHIGAILAADCSAV